MLSRIVSQETIPCPGNCGAVGLLTIWGCGCRGYMVKRPSGESLCSSPEHNDFISDLTKRARCKQLGWAGDHVLLLDQKEKEQLEQT